MCLQACSYMYMRRFQTSVLSVVYTGSPCKFVVVTANAGAGTMAVTVEGTSKVAVICTEVDEGYEFSYTPSAPGDYMINIRFCNVSLAGSPFKATVVGRSESEINKYFNISSNNIRPAPAVHT